MAIEVGGKGSSLIRLEKEGFHVPRFFVVDSTISQGELESRVEQELKSCSFFAVRSSAQGEDSIHKSFAGHFYSAIGVTKSYVYQEFRKVVDSFGSHKGSVIIQEFIPSDVSGVVFSNAGNGTMLVNATVGLCKSVVEGEAVDEYQMSQNGKILHKRIASGKKTLMFTDGEIKQETRDSESLTLEQLSVVHKQARNIEKFFGIPQDIEWCFFKSDIYILQSRPITKKILFEEEYFDSANIAESYSGIVLPLTCSFASRLYRQVYRDFLHKSGVSMKKINEHGYVFDELLGFYRGRMYYNMNNWYRMAQFVPGYKRNKRNFETMITSNLRKEIDSTIKPSLLLTVVYIPLVSIKVFFFDWKSKRFERYVSRHLAELSVVDTETMPLEEALRMFDVLENNLLRKWYITLENDFFIMTYLGLLEKYVSPEELQDIISFTSSGTGQVQALCDFSQHLKSIPELWSCVTHKQGDVFFENLSSYPDLQEEYNRYVEKFGGRFANELKLETLGVEQDPNSFMTLLELYSQYTPLSSSDSAHVKDRGTTKFLYRYVLKRFKKYGSKREDFRLLRTNMYALNRKIFRRIGQIFTEQGIIDDLEDIFNLQVEQIFTAINSPKAIDLKKIVAESKQKYQQYKKQTSPAHFIKIGEVIQEKEGDREQIDARGASPGRVTGRVRVFKEFEMPSDIDFDILVTKHTDPGWTSLIALSKGLIIEHGGVLSHASIVARELGIPAVIGVENATDIYVNGQTVELDGSNGTITVL